MKLKILVAEPDEMFAAAVAYVLEQAGYEAVAAHDSRLALDQARTFRPDLCILSAALPAVSQYQLCCDLRRDNTICFSSPILMLGNDSHEDTCAAMLECGVDDYLVKPFGMPEFMARVFNLLRRSKAPVEGMPLNELCVGRFTLDLRERSLTVTDAMGSRDLPITQTEARLLQLLLLNAGSIVTREVLMERIWGAEEQTNSRNVLDNFILSLRRKIEANTNDPQHILSVRGLGFRFRP